MKARIQFFLAALFLLMTMAPIAGQAQAWSSDPVHSTVMYTIRHGFTPMVGMFKKFDVTMTFDPTKAEDATINATVDVNSVMMGISKLEDHLKSPDFFDAAQFPTWTFASKGVSRVEGDNENKYIAKGEMTVHGVTKSVEIPFEFLGMSETPRGNKAGAMAEFTIDRVAYGIGNPDTANLGGDVKVTVYLELNGKK